MITILFLMVSTGLLAIVHSKRYQWLTGIAKGIEWAAETAGQISGSHRLGIAGLFLAVLFLLLSIFHQAWLGFWVLCSFTAFSLAAVVASDAALGWAEKSLGRLVRNEDVKRHTQLLITFSAVIFVARWLFPDLPGWAKLGELVSLLLVFSIGVWIAFRAVRLSLFGTSPRQGEKLASFLLAVLGTFVHHGIVLGIFSTSFLVHLNSLMPHTFLHAGTEESAGVLLLAGYVISKFTITGSGFVQPSPGLGYALDTLLGVLGYALSIFVFTSLFALLQQVKPDEAVEEHIDQESKSTAAQQTK